MWKGSKGSKGAGKGKSKEGKSKEGKSKEAKSKGSTDAATEPVEPHGNVFVRNLPDDMTEIALRQLFEGYGVMESVKLIPEKCVGFVRYSSPEEARACIEELHNFMPIPGRRLGVTLAMNDKGQGYSNRKALGETVEDADFIAPPGCTVFVYYVPEIWEEETLALHFKHCGQIGKTTIMKNESGSSKGYGFVSFVNPASASKAIIGMNGFNTSDVNLRRKLKVGPKKGEEELFPRLPEFPPPGDMDDIVPMSVSPPGATAFIFHLPQSWDEGDLHRRMIHFGNILNITIQRSGGQSKGFGFVGFDCKESVRRAVDGFSGFDTGEGKFLKVELKTGDVEVEKEAEKPEVKAPSKLDLAEKMAEKRRLAAAAKSGGAVEAGKADWGPAATKGKGKGKGNGAKAAPYS